MGTAGVRGCEVVGWEEGRAAGREGVRGDGGAGVGFGVQEWDLGCRGGGEVRIGFRAGIWGAVLGFEGQGRRGMQSWVQTWDLGCRGGLSCKHKTWGAGGNLGYRRRSGVQGEIWGADTKLRVQE